jgi:hypothetical protein
MEGVISIEIVLVPRNSIICTTPIKINQNMLVKFDGRSINQNMLVKFS